MTKYKKLIVTMVVACAACALLASGSVDASGIIFDVIGPRDLACPAVKDVPFDIFIQYGFWNNDRKMYNRNGHKVDGPGTDTFVGITKYVHFWSLESTPGVGWASVVVIPEVRIEGPSVSFSGIGDPLASLFAWFNPTPNSTLALQYLIQVPIGDDEVTYDYWAHILNLWYAVQMGKVSFDVEGGGVFRTDRHKSGEHDLDPSDTFFTNIRLGYRATQLVEPFVAIDYERTGKATDRVTGGEVTGLDALMLKSDSHETALGAGLMFHLKDTINFTMRYSRSIDGRNTIVTDALHVKFIYVW